MKKCKKCNNPIPEKKNAHNVKYCEACRKEAYAYNEYRANWQRQRDDNNATKPKPNTIQCLICSKWYRKVGAHIVQRHGITAREYREAYNLEVKRGLLTPPEREILADHAINNGTYKNLEKGAPYRFTKGKSYNYKRSPITIERLKKNRFKNN